MFKNLNILDFFIEEAGAFMVVLEGIPKMLADVITEKISIPTIGIGAGAGCDMNADQLIALSDIYSS